jgi:nucleotide-binding universal stress UspA family protein
MEGQVIVPEIKKILCATDLSANARYSFVYAASLAHRYGAGITIIHVLEPEIPDGYANYLSSYLTDEKWEDIKKRQEEEAISAIKTRLAQFSEEVAREHVSCLFNIDEIIAIRGNPVEKILLYTKSGDFDMVVMGSRGLGAFVDAMIGSTARRVLRRCEIPVLVVRLPKDEE